MIKESSIRWACGAVGSALPWHGRGREFESHQVHQSVSSTYRPPARQNVASGVQLESKMDAGPCLPCFVRHARVDFLSPLYSYKSPTNATCAAQVVDHVRLTNVG